MCVCLCAVQLRNCKCILLVSFSTGLKASSGIFSIRVKHKGIMSRIHKGGIFFSLLHVVKYSPKSIRYPCRAIFVCKNTFEKNQVLNQRNIFIVKFSSPSPVKANGYLQWNIIRYLLKEIYKLKLSFMAKRVSQFKIIISNSMLIVCYSVESRFLESQKFFTV